MASGGKFEADDEPMLGGDDDDFSEIKQQPARSAAPQMPPAYTPPVTQQPTAPSHPPYPYPLQPGAAVPLGVLASAAAPVTHVSNTTVIINQPGRVERGPRDWSSSLCSCCDDMGSCLLGWFCPCVLAGKIASGLEESCCVPCCVPGWLIVLRTKLRAENNIQGSVMDDCCTVCCCGVCVMCQMARELKFIKNSYRPSYN